MNASITYNELANYNNGRLVYKTFDLDGVSKDEHLTELTEWLDSLPPVHGCPCEEYCVGDAEGIPSGMVFDSGVSDEFFELMEAIDNGADEDAVMAYMDIYSQWDASHFDDSYCGHYGSDALFADSAMANYSRENFEQCFDIPEALYNYIDWQQVETDCSMDHSESDGHIFRSC